MSHAQWSAAGLALGLLLLGGAGRVASDGGPATGPPAPARAAATPPGPAPATGTPVPGTATPTGSATPVCGLPAWQFVTVPGGHHTVTSVAAVAPGDAWAAAGDLLHWDGTVWQVAPQTPPGMSFALVAAGSATSVWAAPGYPGPIAHWDGGAWRVLSVPAAAAPDTLI